jgi:hypothetical protein
MSDFKPRPGTSLPFLEAENKRQEHRPKASPLTLLQILSRQSQRSLPMFDLQAQAGMEPSRYGEALKSLRDAGYIEIQGEAPEQMIHLTESGLNVTLLTRPA